MKRTAWVALFLAIFSLSVFCAGSQELSEPEKGFEYRWRTLDRNYAIFGPKHVDWQALCQEGLAAMTGFYRDLKAKDPGKVDESVLNALGYDLMSIEDMKKQSRFSS